MTAQVLRRRRRVGLGAAAFLAGSVLVHAGNYAFNLVAVRVLTPAEYADIALAVTLLLLTGFVTVGFQTATARTVAEHEEESADRIARWVGRRAFRLGLWLGGLVVVTSPMLAATFRTGSVMPFLAVGAGLPWAFAAGVGRGRAQGLQRFGRLAWSFQAEMIIRLGVGAGLLAAGFGVTGGVGALWLSLVAAALCIRLPATGPAAPLDVAARRRLMSALWPSMALLVGEALSNHADTIVVKQAFDPTTAGVYAAIALVGRSVFFVTWPISMLLFPAAARRAAQGGATRPILIRAVVAVMVIGVSATVVVGLEPAAVVRLLLGAEYVGGAHLLAPYVAATALFAGAATSISFLLATGVNAAGYTAAASGFGTALVISLLDSGVEAVVWTQVVLMAAYFVATLIWALRRDRSVP